MPEPIVRAEAAVRPRGVWGVRNYHTALEQRALAGASMSGGYVAMVIAAASLATTGLLLDSAAAVSGRCELPPSWGRHAPFA